MVQKLQRKSNSTKKQPWLCLEWTEIQRLQNLPKPMQANYINNYFIKAIVKEIEMHHSFRAIKRKKFIATG